MSCSMLGIHVFTVQIFVFLKVNIYLSPPFGLLSFWIYLDNRPLPPASFLCRPPPSPRLGDPVPKSCMLPLWSARVLLWACCPGIPLGSPPQHPSENSCLSPLCGISSFLNPTLSMPFIYFLWRLSTAPNKSPQKLAA